MASTKSVFISYSSKDGLYVDKLTRMLEKMQISYWKAPDMIPAGSNYAKEIPQAIQNCKVFVLLLSDRSQNSIWVEKEIDSAVYYRKKILPFQIDDAPLNDMFRFYLNNVQTISYHRGRREAVEELKRRLRQILEMGEEISPPSYQGERSGKAPAKSPAAERSGKASSKRRATGRNRTEALTMNHVPEECQYCGGEVKFVEKGTYRCQSCGKDNYDYFQTVRNYLEQAGAHSALEIERDTGVPRRVVEHLLKEDYLEIPKLSSIRISCERCGSPIRSGTLCELCSREQMRGTSGRSSGGQWRSRRQRNI